MSARFLSASWRAPARPSRAGPAPRSLALAALVPLVALFATLLVNAAAGADPIRVGRWLDPAAARRAGVAVQLRASSSPPGLVEVLDADGGPLDGVLLALAPDGGAAAIADAFGPAATAFALARVDGSQLRLPVEGVLGAAFSADASRVAIVDGRGRLGMLDVASGELRAVAEGPFADVPLVDGDGGILALAVPSVDAPFQSRLVRVTADGSQAELSDEELVYDAWRMADGALALVVHRPGGTQVRRLVDGATTLHADLGPDAVNVSVSDDGKIIAFERAGRVFVHVGGESRAIGAGSRPQVAGDGASVLLHVEGASSLVDPSGRELRSAAAAAAIAPCGEGCRS